MIRKFIASLTLAVLIFCGVAALDLGIVTLPVAVSQPLSSEEGAEERKTTIPLTTTLPGSTATLVQPAAQGSQSDLAVATLYYRYYQTSFLGREERVLSVPRDDAVELTIVQALISGPSSSYQELVGLFPPDTQVVATRRSGNLVSVTLSEAFLAPPADAPKNWESFEYWRHEIPLRRQLAVLSIANALTESGRCERVQILIATQEGDIQGDRLMRSAIYTDEADPSVALEPLKRNEDVILSPRGAVRAVLSMWQSKSWETLYVFMAKSVSAGDVPLPSQTEFLSEVSLREVSLLGYSVGTGTVSVDGMRATVPVNIQVQRSDGSRVGLEKIPVPLTCENGNWKLSYASLLALMDHQ